MGFWSRKLSVTLKGFFFNPFYANIILDLYFSFTYLKCVISCQQIKHSTIRTLTIYSKCHYIFISIGIKNMDDILKVKKLPQDSLLESPAL